MKVEKCKVIQWIDDVVALVESNMLQDCVALNFNQYLLISEDNFDEVYRIIENE